MKLNLSRGRMYQVQQNEKHPRGPSPLCFEDVLRSGKHSFIFCDYKAYEFKPYLQDAGLGFEDFEEIAAKGADESHRLRLLEEAWRELCERHAHEHGPEAERRIILLPRIRDARRAQGFFGEIRNKLMGWEPRSGGEREKGFQVIFLGDYPTYLSMIEEIETGGTSPLGQILVYSTWLVENLSDLPPTLDWLCGGDGELIHYFVEHQPQAEAGDEAARRHELRRVTHQLVNQMLSPGSPLSMETRLRYLLDVDLRGDMEKIRGEDYHLLQNHLSYLYRLLPGSFEGEDAMPHFHEQKRQARWQEFHLLRKEYRRLLAGGFVRYQPDGEGDTRLRLRGPLLAFCLAHYGMDSNLWEPGCRRLHHALTTPFDGKGLEKVPSGGLFNREKRPTGLDLFLDALLDRACLSAENPDAWSVPRLEAKKLAADTEPGMWWKRVPFGPPLAGR